MTGDDFRAASREQWARSAEGWERAAERPDAGPSADAAAWMLEHAAPQPGEHVLELAAGAGRVGLQAAELVGRDGRVVCSDFAEPMVEAIRRRAAARDLAQVEARVVDAERLELGDDERFDVALCRFGYMLMTDPARALRETHRALRPGGRLALAVWGAAERNPWLSDVLDAIMAELDAPPPPPGTPGVFALGDPARLAELLAGAGFDEIDVRPLATEHRFESLDAWWDHLMEISAPVVAILDALPRERADAIRAGARERATRHAGSGGEVRFQAEVVVGRAVRPA